MRLTPELLSLMRETAEKHGISVSAIVHKAILAIVRQPPTEAMDEHLRRAGQSARREPHVSAPKITGPGSVEMQVRCDLPHGVTSNMVREKVYDKCLYALGRPVPEKFNTTMKAGVDYLVEQNG